MKPRERDVERYFKDEVERVGGMHRKARWLDQRGAPDQFVFGIPNSCYKTGFFPPALCEIKRPDEPLKPHQERERKKLVAGGVPYWLIDSHGAVDAFIREATI